MVVEIILPGTTISEVVSVLLVVDTMFVDPALQATMFVDSALQATMFVDSALQATMFSAATSTLSSADRGEGAKTGENEGGFMVIGFTLSPSSNYALVRAKLIPYLGKCQLLSFKERFHGIPFEKFSRNGVSNVFISSHKISEDGGIVGMEVVCQEGYIPSSNLNINLKSHVLKMSRHKESGDCT